MFNKKKKEDETVYIDLTKRQWIELKDQIDQYIEREEAPGEGYVETTDVNIKINVDKRIVIGVDLRVKYYDYNEVYRELNLENLEE